MDPTLGIKFKRKVRSPKRKAIFTLNKTKINHTIKPVAKEVVNLTDRYLDTLANMACTVALAGVVMAFFSPKSRKIIKRIINNGGSR